MFPLRSILFAIVALSVTVVIAGDTMEKDERLTARDRRLFAWFDQLGIEDLSHARLVRVRLGGRVPVSTSRDSTRSFDEPRGFLLWEKDGRFRVVLSDLTAGNLERHGTDPAVDDYVGWRSVSMEEETDCVLRALAQPDPNTGLPLADVHPSGMDLLEARAQVVVLAWFCAAHDRAHLAAHLMRAAERLAPGVLGSSPFEEDFEEEIQIAIGKALTAQATLALADSHQDRHALAARFQAIFDHCPKSHFPEAASEAEVLRKMAAEDDAHPRINESDFARLGPADQARELIFQLRDEFLDAEDVGPDCMGIWPWSRPWPFEPPRGNGSLRKLTALGLVAVPALLEALGDDRPSRAMYRFPEYDLGMVSSSAIQDLASQALSEISGVDFKLMVLNTNIQGLDGLPTPGEIAPAENDWAKARLLAQDWWKTRQEKGEVEWFRTQIASGAHGANQCLDAVAQRHPEVLPELLLKMIPTAPDPILRARMIQMLIPNNTAEVNAFLLEQLTNDTTRTERVAAAYVLRQHHQPEALAAMLAEFETLKPRFIQTPAPGRADAHPQAETPDPVNDPNELLYFLLSSDSPLAVQEMRAILPQCSLQTHMQIAGACAAQLSGMGMGPVEPASRATRTAIEALLVSELQNESVWAKGYAYEGPRDRIADAAADALAEFWSTKYKFNMSAPLGVRTVQIAIIRAKYEADLKLSNKPANSKR